MKDALGRLWKVAQKDGKKIIQCYTKGNSGEMRVLEELDIATPGGGHQSRVRKGGKACNGTLYGTPGMQLCEKCAALVEDRHRSHRSWSNA